ncbi:DNA repair metallo-beta-lactamase-domain-containing protein [Tribonema minus]|uniref:DNA repair metallo-beta-lactamase-domain-containing protein n=1 Tax=Tribonema minus TaxID=303371 RepID=A0A835YYF6_9STRA|nr:DNA repair metallo-beta-lactamase-domain-containing protein [Tribonema minus]
MRYSKAMLSYPKLKEGGLDRVYLDTTYGHPKHVFRPQNDSIAAIVDIVKEKILLAVAKATGLKVYCDERKLRIVECLGLSEEDRGCFTSDMHATPLHTCRMGFCGEIWPFFRPSFGNMTQYLEDNNLDYNSVLGIIPTGWADSSNWNKRHAREEKGNAAVQLIPYSEHSNYTELVEFVTFLKPRLVIPTVFSDENDRKAIIRRFAPLLDHNANKRAFFASMVADKGSSTPSEAASTASGEQIPHLPRNEQDLVENASSTDESGI